MQTKTLNKKAPKPEVVFSLSQALSNPEGFKVAISRYSKAVHSALSHIYGSSGYLERVEPDAWYKNLIERAGAFDLGGYVVMVVEAAGARVVKRETGCVDEECEEEGLVALAAVGEWMGRKVGITYRRSLEVLASGDWVSETAVHEVLVIREGDPVDPDEAMEMYRRGEMFPREPEPLEEDGEDYIEEDDDDMDPCHPHSPYYIDQCEDEE